MGYFLKGLRPELSRGAKASYVEWKNGRLTSALMHGTHAEDQLQEKKDRKCAMCVLRTTMRSETVPNAECAGETGTGAVRARM